MSAPTLQPDHRTACWKSLLTAEMNVFIWTCKCRFYNKCDTALKTIVALTASGTAVASLSIWATHPRSWQAIAVCTGIASVIQAHYFSSDRLAKLSALVADWKNIAIDYGLLWEKCDGDLSSPESWDKFESTKRRELTIDESKFSVSERLRKRAFREVCTTRGLDR